MKKHMKKQWQSGRTFPIRGHNRDRIRRARSWLERSRQVDSQSRPSSDEDDHASDYEKFIFLWIAFNAAYDVCEYVSGFRFHKKKEEEKIHAFLKEITMREGDRRTIQSILEDHGDAIESILKNQYTDPGFWRQIRESMSDFSFPWKPHGPNRDVYEKARELFSRLYLIRNQIFHGGMTYSAGLGKAQVRESSRVLSDLVPAMLKIMGDDIERTPSSGRWGRVHHPNINVDPDTDQSDAVNPQGSRPPDSDPPNPK